MIVREEPPPLPVLFVFACSRKQNVIRAPLQFSSREIPPGGLSSGGSSVRHTPSRNSNPRGNRGRTLPEPAPPICCGATHLLLNVDQPLALQWLEAVKLVASSVKTELYFVLCRKQARIPYAANHFNEEDSLLSSKRNSLS
jgi:hypothetical protein